MDPSYSSSEDEASVMAAAMGFSSFGTQGPTKKRKFNPTTDAVVDGQALRQLDRGGKKGQGSGGNQIPLGRTRVLGVSKTANLDEIDLDDIDDEGEAQSHINGSLPPPSREVGLDGTLSEDEEPQYIDTSLPAPDEAAREAQSKIDSILARVGDQDHEAPKTTSNLSKPSRGIGHLMTALKETPTPPVHTLPGERSAGGRERGQRNAFWYLGYYDPSFNENPWKKLEEKKGWEARGSWIEREVQAQERHRGMSQS